jgi:predicted lipoprotein with Yx(FWY)xxD motif
MIRPLRATAVALCAVVLVSGCGKTITIGDSSSNKQAPPPAPVQSAVSAPPASAPPADGPLQVVDQTAAEDGKTGTGGTVTGITIQEQPPKWVQLTSVKSGSLKSPHLININEASLYRFDKDDSGSNPKSNCYTTCAQTWPPVTVAKGGKVYLFGVDPSKVGAILRTDGTIQLTVGNHPIYRFSKDSKPGDLKGQGVQGTWFAVGPDGSKATGGSNS